MQVEEIGDCTLYQGDCREVFPHLGQCDAMVTDPPYGVGLTGKHGHYRNNPHAKRGDTYQTYADTLANFQTCIVPALTQALTLVRRAAVCMASRTLPFLPPWNDLGGIFLPNGCGIGRWGFQCFMHIVFYGTDPHLATGARPHGRYGLYGNDANRQAHPCAKPLAAMQWAIERVSLSGQTILDPFMGSGTTGVACIQGQRPFIGIEIDPHYFNVACQRLEQATRQLALFPPVPSPPTQLRLFAAHGGTP